MAEYLPVSLNLAGIGCRVVGAGRVAERKIGTLLRAGARVTVIAPRATRRIAELSRRRLLSWRRAAFRPGSLAGARLVFAATSDPAVNRAIAREAARRGLFCNVADAPGLCTMLLPATLKRGSLSLSVATGGESPAFAARLRQELSRRYGPEYGAYVRLIGVVRRRLARVVADRRERERRYRRLMRAPLLRLLRAGRSIEARHAALRAAGFVPPRRAAP